MNQTDITKLNKTVDTFAEEMKKKLHQKAAEGYQGWDDFKLARMIRENLKERVKAGPGQEIDIANLAMMLWNLQQQELASKVTG